MLWADQMQSKHQSKGGAGWKRDTLEMKHVVHDDGQHFLSKRLLSIYTSTKEGKNETVMSRRRIRKKWKDSFALRRGIFYFFTFAFSMIVLFKCLKIVHEPKHREEFHKMVTLSVDTVLGNIK